jgi:hypothetical protein
MTENPPNPISASSVDSSPIRPPGGGCRQRIFAPLDYVVVLGLRVVNPVLLLLSFVSFVVNPLPLPKILLGVSL